MNAKSKKLLTRKLVVLAALLAVMLGSVFISGGVARRNGTMRSAYADEIDSSDLEIVSSGNRLEDLSETKPSGTGNSALTSNNLGKVTIDTLTKTAVFSEMPAPGFFSYTDSRKNTTTVNPKLWLGVRCKAHGTEDLFCVDLTKDMVTDITESSGKNGVSITFTYCSGFTLDLTALFDLFPTMTHSETDPTNSYTVGCHEGCIVGTALSDYSGSTFTLAVVTKSGDGEGTFVYSKPVYGKIATGNVYKLPTPPVKEGYRFTGWYTDPECTVKYEGDTFTDDVTLYAGYVASESFTVTYIDGDETTTETVDYGSSAPIPAKEKIGYTFVGWFYPDNVKYTGQAIKSDVTLTAVYTVKIIKIRFFVDGEEYKSIDVPYGSSFMEVAAASDVSPSDIQSVTVLNSVGGVGSADPADDQSATDIVTSDLVVEVKKSAADVAKTETANWFASAWIKVADFFVGAWNAVCEHFRTQWKWWAIGAGSATALAIVALALACRYRR